MIFTVLDIETTGLNKEKDDLLEVGYMQINENLEIYRSGNLYFYKEHFDVESDAQSIHKLTRSFLAEHENEFTDNIVRLYALLQNGLIIGKNSNKFDIPFIQSFIRRYAPELGVLSIRGTLDMQKYYTPIFRNWYRQKYGAETRKHGTLSELMDVIEYTPDMVLNEYKEYIDNSGDRQEAHSALYDVYMTYLLVKVGSEKYGLQIIDKSGMSLAEKMYANAKQYIEEMSNSSWDFQQLFGKAFRNLNDYYDLTDKTRTNAYIYREFIKMCLSESFSEGFSECQSQVGVFYVLHGVRIMLYEVAYWLLENYLLTKDAVFLDLGKKMYEQCLPLADFEQLSTNSEAKKHYINLDYIANNNSLVKMLYAYNLERASFWKQRAYIDMNSAEDVALFRDDNVAFWRKAIPTSNLPLRDFMYGVIIQNKECAQGVSMLIKARGGLS